MATVSVKDFDRCCRCCLETVGSMTPIYSGCLQDMFNKILQLQIAPNDGYPQQMCFRCIRRLSSAHTFYDMVMKNHTSLERAVKGVAGLETSVQKLPNDENVEFVVIESEPDTECIVKIGEAREKINKPLFVRGAEKTWEKSLDSEDSHQSLQYVHKSLSQEDMKDVAVLETSVQKLPKVENVQFVVIKSEPDTECIIKIEAPETINKPLVKKKTRKKLLDSEDGHQCPQCAHRTSSQEDMMIHLKTHLASKHIISKVLPKPHLCSQCGKRFCLRTSLAKHMRLHRGNFFQCKYCDKKFVETSTLKVHLVSHNLVNPKPFWCGVCKKCFSQKSSLKKHEKIHRSPPAHPCAHCEKSFRHACSLQKHCLREHETVQCDVCSRSFVGKKNLDMHVKIHRPSNLTDTAEENNKIIDQVDIESVKVEFLCMLCVTKFESKEGMEAHLCSSDNVT